MTRTSQPDWDILLIGGHSTSGKSTVARQLGRRFAVPVNQVDDYRIALQRATQPGQIAGLHFFSQEPNLIFAEPMPIVVAGLIRIGQIMSYALEDVIAHHVLTRMPIILEGDGITPALATIKEIDGVSVAGRIKSVFIIEPSEAAFAQTYRERWPDSESSPHTAHWRQLAWRYGQWLSGEAKQSGLPIVEPKPWATLEERIMMAI